jgi:hypothetical protein
VENPNRGRAKGGRSKRNSANAQTTSKAESAEARLALLGMINWIYQWHKPEGDLQTQEYNSAIH